MSVENLDHANPAAEQNPKEQYVWYVSYGSNIDSGRFEAYITGGTPPGSGIEHKGCADTTLPIDEQSIVIPQSLYFAGRSHSWGGTSGAFIAHQEGPRPTLAKAYLITPGQLKGVVEQENSIDFVVPDVTLDVAGALEHGSSRMLDTGFYTELLYCGNLDGYPMLSFTASKDWIDYGPPSGSYLTMIGSGLMKAHGLDAEQLAGYFADVPGVAGELTTRQLVEIFDKIPRLETAMAI